ncbi:hypothetical protein U1Q18_014671 [Sarracenia purpurea var. burkii]
MLDEVTTEIPHAMKLFQDTLFQPKIKDKVFDCGIDDLSDEEDVSNQLDPSEAHGDHSKRGVPDDDMGEWLSLAINTGEPPKALVDCSFESKPTKNKLFSSFL